MQPRTDPSTTDDLADWPSLIEFKQSKFPEYDPATDADAEQDDDGGDGEVDFVLPL